MLAGGDPGAGGPTPCQCHTSTFQACSSPMGPASPPRSLGPWEVAQDSPAALAPARSHLALRGKATPASSLYYPEPWFPWCAGKAGKALAILLAHLKGKETEAQGIQAWGLGDGLEVAYFFPPPPGNRGPSCPAQRQGLTRVTFLGSLSKGCLGGSKARWVDEVWGPEIEHGLNDFKARPGVSAPSPSLHAVCPCVCYLPSLGLSFFINLWSKPLSGSLGSLIMRSCPGQESRE